MTPTSSLLISPLSSTVRFYSTDISSLTLKELSSTGIPYYKTLTLLHLDNGHIRVLASESAPTLKELSILATRLASLGYISASWSHKGKETTLDLTKYLTKPGL